MEQKTLGFPFRTVAQMRKMLEIPCSGKNRRKLSEFRSEAYPGQKYAVYSGAGFFVKLIVFMPFSSVPSLGIDSSVNLGMPRKEHFLARNNGSLSESIPRYFFGTKFRRQPQ